MHSLLKRSIVLLLFMQVSLVCCQSAGAEAQIVNKEKVSSLLRQVEEGSAQLLDVRTPEEFNRGAIPGALNLDIRSEDFTEQLEDLDKDKPVILYCQSGFRSNKAAGILLSLGFTQVLDYKGGYSDWYR